MAKIAGALLLFCLPAFGQRVDFFREDVTFRLDGLSLRVEGLYWFANHSNRPAHAEIFYPFPDPPERQADSVRVFDLKAGRRIGFKSDGFRGVSFPLALAIFDTAMIQVGYRQICSGDSAVYLLRTTRTWHKPLDRAEFKLVVPDDVVLEGFSYPPDKTYPIGRETVYYWAMTGFMPEKDMIFHFRRAEP
jgi:hypothetical protein